MWLHYFTAVAKKTLAAGSGGHSQATVMYEGCSEVITFSYRRLSTDTKANIRGSLVFDGPGVDARPRWVCPLTPTTDPKHHHFHPRLPQL